MIPACMLAQPNQVDEQGRKQGPWQKKYEGINVLQYKGQFKNDKPVGKFTYYYKSSNVKAVIKHDENSNRSIGYYFHENGALMSYGIFRDQKKDSIWLNFGPSQRISNTETYKNGVLHGKKVIYYIPEILTDKSQIPMSVAYYEDGLLQGEYREYHNNLTMKIAGTYLDNKKHGEWKHFDPGGKKTHLYRYKNGVKHGWSIGYDEHGGEHFKAYFYYGKRLTGKKLEEKMRQMKELGINPNK